MRLKNYTDIPSDHIALLIAAIRPPGISGFDVTVKNTASGFAGRAYTAGSAYHDRACPFVTVRIARTDAAAREIAKKHDGKGYLHGHAIGSRMEALVFVLAHELRHLWQAKVKRGRRVYGARGRFSERDADAFALSALRRFRRGELGDK